MSTPFTILVHPDDQEQLLAELKASRPHPGPVMVGAIGELDAGFRFVHRSCMGGFCPVRDTCGWHNLEDRNNPAERLCAPGMTDCWTPMACRPAAS